MICVIEIMCGMYGKLYYKTTRKTRAKENKHVWFKASYRAV